MEKIEGQRGVKTMRTGIKQANLHRSALLIKIDDVVHLFVVSVVIFCVDFNMNAAFILYIPCTEIETVT